jgi:hypothetical protein
MLNNIVNLEQVALCRFILESSKFQHVFTAASSKLKVTAMEYLLIL